MNKDKHDYIQFALDHIKHFNSWPMDFESKNGVMYTIEQLEKWINEENLMELIK